ncbi:MAG: metallophosphoesterase family protein [Candidatus Cryptobacteroides sp.]
MKRRNFLGTCAAALGAAALSGYRLPVNGGEVPEGNAGDEEDGKEKALSPRRLIVAVGAEKRFKALHISDSHLTRVSENDGERKKALAKKRARIFPDAERNLALALDYAERNGLYLLHTGDLYDFVSEANLAAASGILAGENVIACVGNHEFSQYVGEAKEDEAYKALSAEKVAQAFRRDITFSSRTVNGVNFVCVDDTYYNFTDRQKSLMKKEFEKGLPVVMLCHVPMYTPVNLDRILRGNNGKCGYMTGVPEAITSTYESHPERPESERWKDKSVQQHADRQTLEFIRWLKRQKNLKAVLCGHCHNYFAEQFSPTAMQYTVGAGYKGDAYEIEFV